MAESTTKTQTRGSFHCVMAFNYICMSRMRPVALLQRIVMLMAAGVYEGRGLRRAVMLGMELALGTEPEPEPEPDHYFP